jgi:hypothetical protein
MMTLSITEYRMTITMGTSIRTTSRTTVGETNA